MFLFYITAGHGYAEKGKQTLLIQLALIYTCLSLIPCRCIYKPRQMNICVENILCLVTGDDALKNSSPRENPPEVPHGSVEIRTFPLDIFPPGTFPPPGQFSLPV